VLDVEEDNNDVEEAAVVVPSAGTEPKGNFWVSGGAEVGDNIRFSGAARGGAVLMAAPLLLPVVDCLGRLLVSGQRRRRRFVQCCCCRAARLECPEAMNTKKAASRGGRGVSE
jgi:hypothetical protein